MTTHIYIYISSEKPLKHTSAIKLTSCFTWNFPWNCPEKRWNTLWKDGWINLHIVTPWSLPASRGNTSSAKPLVSSSSTSMTLMATWTSPGGHQVGWFQWSPPELVDLNHSSKRCEWGKVPKMEGWNLLNLTNVRLFWGWLFFPDIKPYPYSLK